MLAKLKEVINDIERTINGRRFDALRDQIFSEFANIAKFTLTSKKVDERRAVNIAFISPLPPEDTGIATCSFYSIIDFPVNIDVFAPSSAVDWVDAQETIANPKRDSVRIYGINQFLSLDAIFRYKVVVVAVGNSDHHIYLFDFLKRVGAFQGMSRVWFYLHDPLIPNLIQKGKALSDGDFLDLIVRLYPDKLTGVKLKGTFNQSWELHGKLAKHGVLGHRVFKSLGIHKFFVNSGAAEKLLRADLGDDVRVERLFHPCFLPLNRDGFVPTSKKPVLKIGTFGIPGGSKMTELVVNACQKLHQTGHPVELHIAGFQVLDYWRSRNFAGLGFKYHLLDSPTDIELVNAMNAVDVAVQLRDENRGESSGIIPQLLMLGKPVVVSDLGSFKEYGSAVTHFTNESGIEGLSSKILNAKSAKIKPSIQAYTRNHSVKRFQQKLISRALS
jgi:glycosyltransferase involved in cell wall biosynthesis